MPSNCFGKNNWENACISVKIFVSLHFNMKEHKNIQTATMRQRDSNFLKTLRVPHTRIRSTRILLDFICRNVAVSQNKTERISPPKDNTEKRITMTDY